MYKKLNMNIEFGVCNDDRGMSSLVMWLVVRHVSPVVGCVVGSTVCVVVCWP